MYKRERNTDQENHHQGETSYRPEVQQYHPNRRSDEHGREYEGEYGRVPHFHGNLPDDLPAKAASHTW